MRHPLMLGVNLKQPRGKLLGLEYRFSLFWDPQLWFRQDLSDQPFCMRVTDWIMQVMVQ